MDVGAGADVPKKRAIASVSWDSRVINPAICAVTIAKSILHPECLPGVEVRDVRFQAPIKILSMNSLGPAVSQLLRHAAASESQPQPIEPDTAPIRSGDPNHDRRGVHNLAEARV